MVQHTRISNVQNPLLNAIGTASNIEWNKQQEIQDLLEEQVANETHHTSLDESHNISYHCIECNN